MTLLPIDFPRAVSIGWTVRHIDPYMPCIAQPKAMLVRPSGFVIAAKATAIHKITNATASEHGRRLEDVLREFLADVAEACAAGGRLCAHHFEVTCLLLEFQSQNLLVFSLLRNDSNVGIPTLISSTLVSFTESFDAAACSTWQRIGIISRVWGFAR